MPQQFVGKGFCFINDPRPKAYPQKPRCEKQAYGYVVALEGGDKFSEQQALRRYGK